MVNINFSISKKLYKLLKSIKDAEENGCNLTADFVEANFSEDVINSAFMDEYISLEHAPQGCPPEFDCLYITEKGKNHLQKFDKEFTI